LKKLVQKNTGLNKQNVLKFGLIFLIFTLFLSAKLNGQQVEVHSHNEPLNKVLSQLINNYNASISFNDNALSKYLIDIDRSFSSLEDAVNYLINNLPFESEINNGVIIIFSKKINKKKQRWIFSGRVVEKGSDEPLPYSHIIINDFGTVSDQAGNFSFTSEKDSIFKVKISHLGYYIIDTVMTCGHYNNFYLTSSSIGLSEVIIKNKSIERGSQYGQQPGLIKLNNRIASFLPGYGDNSVFNLLRLQPGILASGEQTNELIIWGSYEGQSKVTFDGFTIYGLKNFNDNISSFNPLMAKDIEIYKGGYDVTMGERVGGIVNITGKTGNINHTSFVVTVNNMTLNGLVEIPIAKKGSLVLAFRHTYYNLYDQNDLAFLIRQNNDTDTTNDVDIDITPDYRFRDLNIKYSTRFGKNQDLFYISFYGGSDKFKYSIDDTFKKVRLIKDTQEENTQSGASVYFGKKWSGASRTEFSFSYSSIRSKFYDNAELLFPQINNNRIIADKFTNNLLTESSLKVENNHKFGSKNSFDFGIELFSNRVELTEDTFDIQYLNMIETSSRLNVYAQDKLLIGKNISIVGGFRFTHAFLLKKVYIDPRFSVSFFPNERFKINLALGIYHQFVMRSSVLDDRGNYKYLWVVANNSDVPVLSANHYVIGTTYSVAGFTFNIEGYYKQTYGLTRFIRSVKYNIQDVFNGKSKSIGVDFLVKQYVRSHSFWVSYSLSSTKELFDYFLNGEYRRAPQDQRHEVKVAGLLNFDPIFLSADYVYGSGFPDFIYNQQQEASSNTTYSRLDVSVTYKFLKRKLNGEIGISILNVLNRQNFKLANFERIPANQTSNINIYAEAIPFTPTIFLKIYM